MAFIWVDRMSCDLCGLDDLECRCHIHDMQKEIDNLSETLVIVQRRLTKAEEIIRLLDKAFLDILFKINNF
jgi:hypothetical protein